MHGVHRTISPARGINELCSSNPFKCTRNGLDSARQSILLGSMMGRSSLLAVLSRLIAARKKSGVPSESKGCWTLRFMLRTLGQLFDLDPLEVLIGALLELLRSMANNEPFKRPTAKACQRNLFLERASLDDCSPEPAPSRLQFSHVHWSTLPLMSQQK